jgi:hypothetical protein
MSAAASTHEVYGEQAYLIVRERNTVVPSFYNARSPDHVMTDVVTVNGQPLQHMGETMTVGLLPVERRWAAPVGVDGFAAAIDQREFEDKHLVWWCEDIASKGEQAEEPRLRPVPTVANFLSWKVDPDNVERFIPLGVTSANSSPGSVPPTQLYDQKGDRIITPQEAAAEAKAADEAKDARIEALESKLNSVLRDLGEPAVEKAPKALDVTPCGSTVKSGYMRQHVGKCLHPSCKIANERDKAEREAV